MDKFSRSIESISVVFADGTKTNICHMLKNGIGQMYGYYIQAKCKGWVSSFDIRALIEESEIPRDTILTYKSLPYMKELLSKLSYDEFVAKVSDTSRLKTLQRK